MLYLIILLVKRTQSSYCQLTFTCFSVFFLNMFTSEAHIGRFFSRSGDRETDLHIGSLPIISGGLECMVVKRIMK